MRKFHKIAFLVALGMLLFMTSCADDSSSPARNLQSFILAEFQTEQDRVLSEEINPNLEQLETKYGSDQLKIVQTFERIDRLNQLLNVVPHDLNDGDAFDNLKRELLTLRFNYEEPRATYAIQFDPYTTAGINPEDQEDLELYEYLFEKLALLDLSFELRKLYLSEIITRTLEFFNDKLWMRDFSFSLIEFGVNAPHKIWFQDEKAFLTLGYYENFREAYEVEMANQVFDKTPVQFNLPNEKGLVNYQGKLKIREAGKEVWRAFELRFFVE